MAMLTFFASPETKITAAYATQYTELNTRINNYSLPPYDKEQKRKWWDAFNAEMKNRMKINQCPDLRTMEERIQDSIDHINSVILLEANSENLKDVFDINVYRQPDEDRLK